MASKTLLLVLVALLAVSKLAQAAAPGNGQNKPGKEPDPTKPDSNESTNDSNGSNGSESNESKSSGEEGTEGGGTGGGGGDPVVNCDCCAPTEEALQTCQNENAACQENLAKCEAEKEQLQNELQDIKNCLNKMKRLPIVTLDTGFYYFSGTGNAQRTWSGAQQACAALGLEIATVETAEENTAIKNYIIKSGTLGGANYWLGGQRKVSGNFKWTSSGSDFGFNDWLAGEPNNGGSSCLAYWRDSSGILGWADFQCTASNPYICELPGCGKVLA